MASVWGDDVQPAKSEEEVTAERELGTAVRLLTHRDHHKAVAMLVGAQQVRVIYEDSDWGVGYYSINLVVDIASFDDFTDQQSFDAIEVAYNEVWRGSSREVRSVGVLPALVEADWRTNMNAPPPPDASNQATLAPLPERAPREDQLAFRDQAELVLYRALKAKQASLPKTETLTIIPNSGVRVPTRTWEPDFVVVYKGRAGIIEVDGSSHTKKYASDRSRDYKLEEAGFHTIRRIDVADAENPDEAEAFIESFLARLGK
ncbi:DUF559 domain-containing protein [Modestobacter lacusdianchii]